MYKSLRRIAAALFAATLLMVPAAVMADTIDVSAKVSALLPPSSEVPIIEVPPVTTVNQPTVEITGTCFVMVPTLVVVLVRDNQTIGSGACSPTGTFQITVPLVLGVNVINVKFMNITGDSGSWGAPITITYARPAGPVVEQPVTDTPAASTTPEKSSGTKPGTPQQSLGQLGITLDYDFLTYSTNLETSVTVGVGGGTPPYKVFVGWGDGSSKTFTLEGPDTFILKHLYRTVSSTPMSFVVRVRDDAGESTSVERAVVSFQKQKDGVPASLPLERERSKILPITIWMVSTAVVGLLIVIRYAQLFPEAAKLAGALHLGGTGVGQNNAKKRVLKKSVKRPIKRHR